jgi:NAD(P)-dependent dehydrogenase (short-subunit alcohol dehydrogenase family)
MIPLPSPRGSTGWCCRGWPALNLGITVNANAPGFIATERTQGLTDEARQRVAGRGILTGSLNAGEVLS